MRKMSLFLASMGFSLSRFFPARRQQIWEMLEELSQDLPDVLFCQDVLEVWLEDYGVAGLILGNIGLFLLGFLALAGLDLLLRRCHCPGLVIAVHLFNSVYCYLKFQAPHPEQNWMILLFLSLWLFNGFQWSLAFVFLLLFTNVCMKPKGGHETC